MIGRNFPAPPPEALVRVDDDPVWIAEEPPPPPAPCNINKYVPVFGAVNDPFEVNTVVVAEPEDAIN